VLEVHAFEMSLMVSLGYEIFPAVESGLEIGIFIDQSMSIINNIAKPIVIAFVVPKHAVEHVKRIHTFTGLW
jgi:hypothetical protein